jgi:hypothetical protein
MRKGTKHKPKTKAKMSKGLIRAHARQPGWFRNLRQVGLSQPPATPTPEASKETDEKANKILDQDPS